MKESIGLNIGYTNILDTILNLFFTTIKCCIMSMPSIYYINKILSHVSNDLPLLD